MRWAVLLMCATCGQTATAAEPFCTREAIFPPEPKHNHASCVVERANGDLLVAWYRGSGERTADDVQIMAARLRPGQTAWDPRFVLADTPGYPDCNPALFAPADGSLWLFWPTILDHRWEGALLKYAMARDWPAGPDPAWVRTGVFHVTPRGFADDMAHALDTLHKEHPDLKHPVLDRVAERSKDELYQRLGWMPRVHPLVLPSGRWLLPLYSDTFSASIIAISDDQGASWSVSRPLFGFGNIQPSLVRKNDGTLVAFMRDNGPHRRIRLSTSSDQGESWSAVTDSSLPNPGAGIEAVRLASGRWLLAYNDTERGRHSLALSLSDDEGRTWRWTRHLERAEPGRESFHYPSVIQARDGSIHVTYTHGGTFDGNTIAHARLNEEWVKEGDPL